MSIETVVHNLTVTQFVRVRRRAASEGKTVEEYLSSFLSERVGTTCSDLKTPGKRLSA